MQKLFFFATCLALGAALQVVRSGLRELVYVVKQPLMINCDIASEVGKNVKYEWQKDGKQYSSVSNGDKTLSIQSPDPNTEGIYECLATSELGVASSGPISVRRAYINIPKMETKTHTPVEGRPYELECPQVDAYPKAEISWMRQEKSEQMKHFLTVRTTVGPNNSLYFSNVTQEDANKDVKYICAAVHKAAEETVILAEHVIPELKKTNEPGLSRAVPQYLSKDIVAKEGDTTFIYCVYGGSIAPPDYFFEGKNVNGDDNPEKQRVTRHNRSKGRRLLIKETRLSDQGTYSCKITEPDGTITTHDMRLTVVSAPSFVKKAKSKITAKTGQDVVLPCQVKGVPAPKVTRTFNAKPLKTGDSSAADLIKEKVQKSDAGFYGCKAYNENGVIYAETLLTVV